MHYSQVAIVSTSSSGTDIKSAAVPTTINTRNRIPVDPLQHLHDSGTDYKIVNSQNFLLQQENSPPLGLYSSSFSACLTRRRRSLMDTFPSKPSTSLTRDRRSSGLRLYYRHRLLGSPRYVAFLHVIKSITCLIPNPQIPLLRTLLCPAL